MLQKDCSNVVISGFYSLIITQTLSIALFYPDPKTNTRPNLKCNYNSLLTLESLICNETVNWQFYEITSTFEQNSWG